MRRLVISASAVLALSIPVGVTTVVVGPSTPAWAGPGVVCKEIAGNAISTVTISRCTPRKRGNTSATGVATVLTTGGTMTWRKSGQTTVTSLSVTSPGQGVCLKGYTESIAAGSVIGGNSTYTHVGDPVSVSACVDDTTNKIVIAPHTSVDL